MAAGKFLWGVGIGMAAGAALGMVMAPSKRELRRAADRAVRHVENAASQAMDGITDAVDHLLQ